jgi:2-keto-4-pentenoate hydratase
MEAHRFWVESGKYGEKVWQHKPQATVLSGWKAAFTKGHIQQSFQSTFFFLLFVCVR